MHLIFQVRKKYLELVKLHHPDTRNFGKKSEVLDDESSRIDEAYRGIQRKFYEDEVLEKEIEEEYGLYFEDKSHMERMAEDLIQVKQYKAICW